MAELDPLSTNLHVPPITPIPPTDSSTSTSSSSGTVLYPRTLPAVDPADPAFQGLGKRAQKRLLRERRYEETRLDRRRAEKEKARRKKAELRELVERGLATPVPKKQKVEQEPTGLRVVIDCSFDELMTQKEINSMGQQIIRCYSANRASPRPTRDLVISSHGGRIKQRFDMRHKTAARWAGVTWDPRPYEEAFPARELIYLTADAEERLLELEEDKVYVIGGIVDKNRHKRICYDKAIKQGIRTAQLPIGDFIKMASRKILTVNHVFEILLKYMEYRDWQRAFLEVIPQRKFKENQGGGRKRRNGRGNKSGEGDGEDGESDDEEGNEEGDEEGDEEDEDEETEKDEKDERDKKDKKKEKEEKEEKEEKDEENKKGKDG